MQYLLASLRLLFNQNTHSVCMLRGCLQHILRDSRKPCAFDPKRLCCQTFGKTIQESDLPHPIDSRVFSEPHMKVLNVRRKLARQFRTNERIVSDEEGLAAFRIYKVVKNGVSNRHLEYTSDFCRIRCFQHRKSHTPSKVDVPRPSSSRMTRLLFVAFTRMSLVSDISTMNVERPRASSSEATEHN